MQLSRIRADRGLSKGAMVRELRTEIRGFDLNEALLDKFEKGQLSSARVNAIEKAVHAVYGVTEVKKKRAQTFQRFRLGRRAVFFVLIVFILLMAALLSFMFRDHEFVKEFRELLGILAALASVLGLLAGIALRDRD
ncbi:hypothetical protein [uncultured Roseovarius sp.]|uniref:hypothetical protein n=1 Tax=uncultured Roseovarius sp. TaxID=293344 RepID=UPI0026163FE1|nr:hypothetical protein [uncultured Roseovarius sp.]